MRSRTGGVTEREYDIWGSGEVNYEPKERGANQVIPGDQRSARWVITGENILHAIDVGDLFFI